MNGAPLALGLAALAALASAAQRGSASTALASGPVRALSGTFRWRKLGSAEFVLENQDEYVTVTTHDGDALLWMPETGWRQLVRLDFWSAYGSTAAAKLATLHFLCQADDGSFWKDVEEPARYTSVLRAVRAAERRVGAPKMEISWR